jgi:NAD(P)-dependent dehydrogenase (short-subunit alcohol dehydrogenase family)
MPRTYFLVHETRSPEEEARYGRNHFGVFPKKRTAAPMHQGAETDEIAGTVLFLCSDTAPYVTGQIFAVEGGRTIRGLLPVETDVESVKG